MGWCSMNLYISSSAPLGSCSKASSSTRSLLAPLQVQGVSISAQPRCHFHRLSKEGSALLEVCLKHGRGLIKEAGAPTTGRVQRWPRRSQRP
jgi:hypothetical protein